MIYRKTLYLTATWVLLLCSIPQNGTCSEPESFTKEFVMQSISNDLLSCIKTNNLDGLLQRLEELQASFKDFQYSIFEIQEFLQTLITQINSQYGTCLTITDACRSLKENFDIAKISREQQADFLMALELFESEETPISAVALPAMNIRLFSTLQHFYPPWEWSFFGLNTHRHHHSKSLHVKKCKQQEFELPPKMALGCVCAFGGALLSILPGGQGAGLWMIGAGVALALEGLAEGERPYYKDTETGTITPCGTPLNK